jgi:sirohydrochlorin ferrochelatase
VTVRPTAGSDNKTIFYGAPVGTHPSMSYLISARAREARADEMRLEERGVARGAS